MVGWSLFGPWDIFLLDYLEPKAGLMRTFYPFSAVWFAASIQYRGRMVDVPRAPYFLWRLLHLDLGVCNPFRLQCSHRTKGELNVVKMGAISCE